MWVQLPPPAPIRSILALGAMDRLGELERESTGGACIYASHTKNALRVVEFLKVKVKYWDLHWTGGFAFLTVRAFDRVSMHSQQAVLLGDCHYCSDWADVTAPEPRNPPRRIDEADEYQDVDPS